ncbi:MAG: ADP-ribosylglycohydrolase family protein [Deltaproteobacteria bacterium]|nr:ADP-ribosylglycohydrolase family protein [Deltaproteobacteria bacterium]
MTALSRAQGCLLGQLAGDSLGALVEFQNTAQINAAYPNGVRFLADGGTWNILAGQPTDDSELALALARTLVKHGTYDSKEVFKAYQDWLNSNPFDIGRTVKGALTGRLNQKSQANGALMRVSPLGIFGVNAPFETLKSWALTDATLTHPNQLCQEANVLYVLAIALAIKTGPTPLELYRAILDWAKEFKVDPTLLEAAQKAKDQPPDSYVKSMGWLLIAFQNALYQLVNAPNLEEGLVDTVGRGGDTDTNAAICGSLLGAVYGLTAVPTQWREAVLNCRPQAGQPGVKRPRPEIYWPQDALELAAYLLTGEKVALTTS